MLGHNDVKPAMSFSSRSGGTVTYGNTSSDAPFTPRLVESLKDKHFIIRVGCTEGCSIALTHEGKAFTWGGSPFFGLLGQKDEFEPNQSVTVPTPIKSMKVKTSLSLSPPPQNTKVFKKLLAEKNC